MPTPVDFSHLRRTIADAARQAFTEVRAAHPTEQFYAFVLYTDDGAMTVVPTACSQEAIQRRAAEDDFGAVPNWLRWATGEWPYEAVGDDHFQAAYDLLNPDERDDEPTPGGFDAFVEQLHAAMTGALADLDAEGFFGEGAAREAITLFCTISDSDAADALERASAQQLNPPAVAARFLADLDAAVPEE